MIRNTRPFLICRRLRFVSQNNVTSLALFTGQLGRNNCRCSQEFGQLFMGYESSDEGVLKDSAGRCLLVLSKSE